MTDMPTWRLLLQVGPRVLAGWLAHYAALVLYTLAHVLVAPLLRRLLPGSFRAQRLCDAWEYGAGLEHGVGRRTRASRAPGSDHDRRGEVPRSGDASASDKGADGGVQTERVPPQPVPVLSG